MDQEGESLPFDPWALSECAIYAVGGEMLHKSKEKWKHPRESIICYACVQS